MSFAVQTIPELLRMRSHEIPDSVALIQSDLARLTYGAAMQRTRDFAFGLRALHVEPGDFIGLVFSNGNYLDFAAAYFGTQLAGCTPVIAPASRSLSTLMLLDQVDPVLTIYGNARDAEFLGHRMYKAELVSAVEELGSKAMNLNLPSGDEDRIAHVVFTTGTTGTRRAVWATHRNLLAAMEIHGTAKALGKADGEVLLGSFPIGTNAALAMLMNCLREPATIVCMDEFRPEAFCETARNLGCTGAVLTPTMAQSLTQLDDVSVLDLPRLNFIGLSGSATPAPVIDWLAGLVPHAELKTFYSCTEAWPSGVNSTFDSSAPQVLGPQNGNIRVVDEQGVPVADGVSGEIELRVGEGRGWCDLGVSETSFEVSQKPGWVGTGDVGYIDDSGSVVLIDRRSRILKCGAMKISAAEIEAALLRHPAVSDAVCIGVPHPTLGSQVAVALVIDYDVATGEELKRELRADLAAGYSDVLLQMRIVEFAEIPLLPEGKIDYRYVEDTVVNGRPAYERPYEAERPIADIWRRALGREDIGRYDDFFDLGGDSLAALKVNRSVSELLKSEVQMTGIYEARTLADFAKLVLENAEAHPVGGAQREMS
ncbi:AMP-binding protein [Streptomyces canus]|uniref:AMP-binding protein n=1 Tax=Streptomyces canus TaxID=58343 RepID=UPI0033B8C59C